MLLKNLMEEKQLNFNRPLISVRRFPSTLIAEKDEKRKTTKSLPNLSPLPYYKSELKSGPVRKPGNVPFLWEQSPGRPKDESQSQTSYPVIPKPPPGRVLKAKPSVPGNVDEKQVISFIEEMERSSTGDGDEAWVDARDTLSRIESFFVNCSLSGLEGPEGEPSGNFSMDPGTSDFMMGRFLPAAKAMVSETPQYSSWEQPVAEEKPRHVKKLTRSTILPKYHEDEGDEESYVEDDDFDEPANLSTKVCGLIPRFCLLNPVPGMSVRTPHMSPVNRTQKELTGVATNKKRSIHGPPKMEPREDKDTRRNKSSQVRYQSDSQNLEGSFLYRRLQGSGISLLENELAQSRFFEEERFSDVTNGCSSPTRCPNAVRGLLADQNTEMERGLGSHMAKKTLYVDSVHKVVSPKSNSFCSDGKGMPNSTGHDFEIIVRRLQEVQSLDLANSTARFFSCTSDQDFGMPKLKGFGEDQCISQKSIISVNSELSNNFEDKQQLTKVENEDSQLPLPPPLPKSPSESWLWRTIHHMSTKNSPSHSPLGTRMISRR